MSISKIFISNSLCVFSQIKDKNILNRIFILLPGSCPGVGLVGAGGVKNFSVGICDGAPLAVRSSLNFVRVKMYRQAIARLRCTSLRLEIEAGRWHKPIRTPVENRKCKRCDFVENEFHFLIECPLYSKLQIQYWDCYFYEHPNNFMEAV